MPANSNCYSEEQLIACLEGTLPPSQSKAIEEHLQGCDACTRLVDEIKAYLLRECGTDSEGDAIGNRDGEPGMAEEDLFEPTETLDYLGKLNGYDIIRVLGRGGYGIVFEARDNALQRNVAIKVLTRDLSKLAVSRRRFIREARAGAAINHPNVVTIHGVDDSGKVPFIVMELIQGETLRTRIRREPKLDLLDILRISSQAAQGLAAAHAQGIIHRDVKPGNIMLLGSLPRVKIADFGLARVATENVELTSRGVAVGTPAYMSPEQVRGEELDARSDLFALGCVMYAMVTGHSPFHGRTALEIAMRIETHHPPRLAELSKDVPEFLDHIVMRLLDKDKEKRFQSAAELADVLGRHLAVLNQTPTDKFPVALRMSMFESPRQPPRLQRPILLGAAALLATVVLAGSGIYFWPRKADDIPGAQGVLSAPGSTSQQEVVPRQLRAEVTVSQSGDADFKTIAEALRNVAAGGKVTIADDGEYHESILLTGSSRYAGLQILAPQHATLRSQQSQPLIKIHAIPEVRLEGLRLVARQDQFGIELTGNCPGAELIDVEIERIANTDGSTASNAAIVIRQAAAGSAERPVVLRGVVCNATNVGLVIGNPLGVASLPPRNILVERCDIRGLSRESSTLLALLGDIEDVQIRRSLFSNGVRGISILVDAGKMPSRCEISHNTWHNLENWFGWTGRVEPPLAIQVHHNLVVSSDQKGLVGDLLAAIKVLPPVFTGNLAVVPSSVVGDHFPDLAQVVPDFPLQSITPGDPGYLKPDFEQLPAFGFQPDSAPGRYSAAAGE